MGHEVGGGEADTEQGRGLGSLPLGPPRADRIETGCHRKSRD